MIISEDRIRDLIRKSLLEFKLGAIDFKLKRTSFGNNSDSDTQSIDSEDTSIVSKISGNIKGNYPGSNVRAVIDALKSEGFTNKFFIVGVLCVVAKESNFKPQEEKMYRSKSRVREVFIKNKIVCGTHAGRKVIDLSDEELDQIMSSKELFFNTLYGGRSSLGNNCDGDGFKYIGRGFNQLTGRHNYKKYGYENNPEAVNNVNDAAKVVARFMKNTRMYSFNEMNSADTMRKGINMAADINGGKKNKLNGRARRNAMARLPHFENLVV